MHLTHNAEHKAKGRLVEGWKVGVIPGDDALTSSPWILALL